MSRSPRNVLTRCLLAAAALVVGGSALAQAARPAGYIYTCTDDRGRRLTADRPIAECTAREQRILNRDGSLRAVRQPTLTAEERAAADAQARAQADARAAANDAIRRDRNLMSRYPDEAAHQRARTQAMEPLVASMKATEQRLDELAKERRPLEAEAEFYKGRALPAKLRNQIESVDAAVDAQKLARQNQEAEHSRLAKLYDAELARLKRLWAGAAPGSLGALPGETAGR